MTLYTILLGVMELLQPHIFKPEHKSALQDALKCYFEMIAAYFNRRDSIHGLIDKFILFLHVSRNEWCSMVAKVAFSQLQSSGIKLGLLRVP